MSSLWIIECSGRSRASDVLRSIRGIRGAAGAGAVIRVEGLSDADRGILAGPARELSWDIQAPLTLSNAASCNLATFLPAGAVPAVPVIPGEEPGTSILLSIVRPFSQSSGMKVEHAAAAEVAASPFETDLRLLSPHTVISLAGDVLASIWDTADHARLRSGLPTGQWLRTLIHASAFPVIDSGQAWESPVDIAEQGSFLARTGGSSHPELIPSMVTVVLSGAADSTERTERTLESLRGSDLGLCPLAVPGSSGDAREHAGKTLLTLLVHPGQQVHPRTGQILLGLMEESSVALLRALVDGSPYPVELWWSRALLLGLQQEGLEIDRFARAYGDERWIAASWAGIWQDGTQPRRIPKRFLEQVG